MKKFMMAGLLLILFACDDKTITEYKDVIALRASQIYNADSVLAYVQKYGEQNTLIADSYLEKAVKLVNSNPQKAVYYYKRAITLLPELKTYLRLAEVLGKLKRTDEVHELYSCLNYHLSGSSTEFLFGKPDENLFYEYIVASIQRYHGLWAEEIYSATESGYNIANIRTRLANEERLHLDTNSQEYKTMMLQFLPYEQIESAAHQPAMFSDFLKSIKDTTLKFDIDEKNVSQFNYEKFNGIEGDDFMQMSFEGVYIYYLKEKQDEKDMWFKFNFNHVLKLPGTYNAVVYAIDSSETACPREMRHVYHRLVTYDNTGNVIDSKVVASQSGEDLSTCAVDHGKITVIHYKRAWQKPYQKADFDNELLSTNRTGESAYEIAGDGRILEVK